MIESEMLIMLRLRNLALKKFVAFIELCFSSQSTNEKEYGNSVSRNMAKMLAVSEVFKIP